MSWAYRSWLLGALVLTALPLLWPTIAPLVDLPGHIGGYRLELDLGHAPRLQFYYGYRWALIGNLGVDLLIKPLGMLFGIELATKLIVIVIPVLTVAGFFWIAHEAHGRIPATAAFALPFAYAYPFQYGFVNYCLAMALACLAFALWLRLGRQGRIGFRAALFVAIAPTIWLAHAIGWVLLCIICGTAEFTRDLQQGRSPLRSVPACLPLAVPLLIMAVAPGEGVHGAHGWFDLGAIVKWIVALNRERWPALDLASAALVLVVVACGLLRRFGLRLTPVLGWPALALFVTYIVAPQAIGDSYFIQARIIPYAAAFALLAIDPAAMQPRARSILALLAVVFFLVRIGATTVSFALYEQTIQRDLTALDLIPIGSSVAVFSPEKCKGGGLGDWANPRVQHLGGIALERRSAFVNDQWALKGLQLVRIRYHQAAPFEAEPSEVVTLTPCRRFGVTYLPDAIARLPRKAFQYVWLLGVPPSSWPHESWLTPVWRAPDAILYRIIATAPIPASTKPGSPDRDKGAGPGQGSAVIGAGQASVRARTKENETRNRNDPPRSVQPDIGGSRVIGSGLLPV